MFQRPLALVFILIALLSIVACRASDPEPIVEPDAGAEGEPVAGMPNPAAVYCEGLGYGIENVVTDAGADADCIFPDGSRCGSWDFLSGRCGQSFSFCAQNGGALEERANIGTCVFPDGSSCSEFDFFEGRCQPGEGAGSEVEEAEPVGRDTGGSKVDVTTIEPVGEPIVEQAVVGWFGYVMSLPGGAQFDDKLVLHPAGAGEVGISGATDAIEADIIALRDKTDPGKNAHFWGKLVCGVPDVNGCQLQVDRLRVDGPGEFLERDTVEGWEGTIAGLSYDEPGAPQPDDAFRPVGEYPVEYGIDSAISAERRERDLADVIASLRDSGRIVRIWGEMTCGVPDAGGCHIEVHRIEDGVDVYQITPVESLISGVLWQRGRGNHPSGILARTLELRTWQSSSFGA